MFLKELIRIADSVTLSWRRKAQLINEILLSPEMEKPVIEIKGWVDIVMRERGKIVRGSSRSGYNIWTNSGREYAAQRFSIATNTPSLLAAREDMITYIGVGTGYQLETTGVARLVTPVPYITGNYLAALKIPPTYPLTPVKTTARYRRVFAENEITTTAGSVVNISELGLFAGGDPSSLYGQTALDTSIGTHAPVAYKSLEEPVSKNDSLELEAAWEIRL